MIVWVRKVVTYRLSEYTTKYQQEDDVHEVDGADGDVENIRSLIHPRPVIADGY